MAVSWYAGWRNVPLMGGGCAVRYRITEDSREASSDWHWQLCQSLEEAEGLVDEWERDTE